MAKSRLLFMLLSAAMILLLVLIMQPLSVLHFQQYISVLFPEGFIGIEQRNLLIIIQVLMLLVILPVYILTFIFSWHYRSDNKKATYDPDLVDNKAAEYIWWGVPLVMTLIVGGLTWVKTYELDPYKPLESDKKPLTIQVVALQWKWLFIYPEEKIATVNFVQFPRNTPIHFVITADAPMNSFWIPHLGGQIYAMPKMRTELNLIADVDGDFRGSSANLSGEGFSGMNFIARSSVIGDYEKWVESVKSSPGSLDEKEYEKLAAPSQDNPVALYQLKDPVLFEYVINKFMKPKKEE
jgi:cytochrome o ubiquinol oxidase subunit 2